MCLRDISPLALQKYILGFKMAEPDSVAKQELANKGIARCLSRELVDKIRDEMSSILGSTVKYGFLAKILLRGCI
jgi:hypothetical protein